MSDISRPYGLIITAANSSSVPSIKQFYVPFMFTPLILTNLKKKKKVKKFAQGPEAIRRLSQSSNPEVWLQKFILSNHSLWLLGTARTKSAGLSSKGRNQSILRGRVPNPTTSQITYKPRTSDFRVLVCNAKTADVCHLNSTNLSRETQRRPVTTLEKSSAGGLGFGGVVRGRLPHPHRPTAVCFGLVL